MPRHSAIAKTDDRLTSLQRAFAWLSGGLLLAAALLAGQQALAQEERGQEEPLRVIAFGDSLVHGYGLAEDDAFPAQLEAALRERGHAVTVVNAGNSGDTSKAGLGRLDWALAEGGDAAIVVLGANDALRGLDPAETEQNLDAILERLTREEALPVLFAGMLSPRNMGEDYATDFDSLYPRLAESHDVVFYPFFLDGVAAEAGLNLGDGIHPNAEGVALIVERILPYAEELLEQTRPAS